MAALTLFVDFNCPFSALASVRGDRLLSTGEYDIEWLAVQHDVTIPAAGEPAEGDVADALASEVASVAELSERDVHLDLTVPAVRSNTAAACAAFAAAAQDADRLRRALFSAVWVEGRDIADPAELERLGAVGRDPALARRWQDEYEALPRPITPTLVLPDGYVSRGLGALSRLADLAAGVPPAAGGRQAPDRTS